MILDLFRIIQREAICFIKYIVTLICSNGLVEAFLDWRGKRRTSFLNEAEWKRSWVTQLRKQLFSFVLLDIKQISFRLRTMVEVVGACLVTFGNITFEIFIVDFFLMIFCFMLFYIYTLGFGVLVWWSIFVVIIILRSNIINPI